jgi:hypothetical protein
VGGQQARAPGLDPPYVIAVGSSRQACGDDWSTAARGDLGELLGGGIDEVARPEILTTV